MSDPVAAAPTPAQTTSPNATATTPAPQFVAKASAEARRTAILAGYDILRPAGEVDARAQGVSGKAVGEVVAELEFMLTGLLRDIDVGAEANAIREGEVGFASR